MDEKHFKESELFVNTGQQINLTSCLEEKESTLKQANQAETGKKYSLG